MKALYMSSPCDRDLFCYLHLHALARGLWVDATDVAGAFARGGGGGRGDIRYILELLKGMGMDGVTAEVGGTERVIVNGEKLVVVSKSIVEEDEDEGDDGMDHEGGSSLTFRVVGLGKNMANEWSWRGVGRPTLDFESDMILHRGTNNNMVNGMSDSGAFSGGNGELDLEIVELDKIAQFLDVRSWSDADFEPSNEGRYLEDLTSVCFEDATQDEFPTSFSRMLDTRPVSHPSAKFTESKGILNELQSLCEALACRHIRMGVRDSISTSETGWGFYCRYGDGYMDDE
jgi:hypothetical protein